MCERAGSRASKTIERRTSDVEEALDSQEKDRAYDPLLFPLDDGCRTSVGDLETFVRRNDRSRSYRAGPSLSPCFKSPTSDEQVGALEVMKIPRCVSNNYAILANVFYRREDAKEKKRTEERSDRVHYVARESRAVRRDAGNTSSLRVVKRRRARRGALPRENQRTRGVSRCVPRCNRCS